MLSVKLDGLAVQLRHISYEQYMDAHMILLVTKENDSYFEICYIDLYVIAYTAPYYWRR